MKTVEFRDGDKQVPDHVAWLLRNLDTYLMSYEEAIRKAETQLLRERLNNAQQRLVDAHFRQHR